LKNYNAAKNKNGTGNPPIKPKQPRPLVKPQEDIPF
jgi:hypothetical protein